MNRRWVNFKIIISCLSGNVLEWFDFAVYGYLAPIIATQFFPSTDKLTSILLTYSVFAIGFFVRPFGAAIFGHIGDTRGRKTALILSTLAMAVPTFLIGILPVYATIGIWAPLLLILCRVFQGLSVGGEFTGSFVYLVEQASHGYRGFFSCWSDIGCNLGMILGSTCVAFLNGALTEPHLSSYGWRLPFLGGIFLATLALFMRSQLPESTEFLKIKHPPKKPVKDLLLKHPRILIFSTLLIAINSLGFYVLVVFIPNQAVLLGRFHAEKIYLMNTIILAVVMVSTFISARACDYFDKTKIYKTGIISCAILSYPVFYALTHFNLIGQIIMLCLMAAGVGCCFGPRPLFMVGTFSPALRFSGIAIALNVGNAIFGGTSPLIATYLVAKTHSIEAASILIILAALISLVSIFRLRSSLPGGPI